MPVSMQLMPGGYTMPASSFQARPWKHHLHHKAPHIEDEMLQTEVCTAQMASPGHSRADLGWHCSGSLAAKTGGRPPHSGPAPQSTI